ncbi:hypothetical protein ABEB36_009736 [Hypothenemus hampei]
MNNINKSDDEEDLEALRLAALKSLKKSNSNLYPETSFKLKNENNSLRPVNRPQGRYFHKNGRFQSGRMGQRQTGRFVSSNLIPLTPSITNEGIKQEIKQEIDNSTFLMPQESYKNIKHESEEKPDESSSKFDRYRDTDKSDEEDSEDEALKSGSEDDGAIKLTRSLSLEALMQELDDEIEGRTRETNEKAKDATDIKVEEKIVEISVKKEIEVEVKTEDVKEKNDALSKATVEGDQRNKTQFKNISRMAQSRRRGFRHTRPTCRNVPPASIQQPPAFLMSPNPIFLPNPPIMFPPAFNPLTTVPFYERPLSPLLINAETLQTQTMAPLSPRSAAFVLENRAIIEKRKRSPPPLRRSYSRSPSTGRDRSPSPRRRSVSPRRRGVSPKNRSQSPISKSLNRKRSRSPVKRATSPKRRLLSPKRRENSPKQRQSVSPKRRERKDVSENKNKLSVKERLGIRNVEEIESVTKIKQEEKEEKPLLDPILEARKKKFESKEINIREGVIRLKPTEKKQVIEKQPKQEDVKEEDPLLDDYELDLEAQVDLFSEDECPGENVKTEPDPISDCKKELENKIEIKRKWDSSPEVKKSKKFHSNDKKSVKVKSERHPKGFERKIEIKINSVDKEELKIKCDKERIDNGRKVTKLNNDEEDIIVEVDDESENSSVTNEGDLRAQLSKKRAEKMQKAPKTQTQESISSRLLQNALQNVLKKPKKKSKELSNSEGKLPIHLRLGATSTEADTFTKSKHKKSKKRRKNFDEVHQV